MLTSFILVRLFFEKDKPVYLKIFSFDSLIHDIKNPLSSIIFTLNSDTGFQVQELSKEATFIKKQLNRWLYEENKEEENISFKTILEEYSTLLPVNVEISCRRQMSNISIDKYDLYRIFDNLIMNACESGATQVKIKVNDSSYVKTIDISNNGKKIDNEIWGKLFHHKFSTKGHSRGHGLVGARFLAKKNGGSITLLGSKWTSFRLTFPLD